MATAEELDAMTKDELLEEADRLGLDVSGSATKAEIRAEIDHASQPEPSEESEGGVRTTATSALDPTPSEAPPLPRTTDYVEMENVPGTAQFLAPVPNASTSSESDKAAPEIAGS
jgi:hypothetical protein